MKGMKSKFCILPVWLLTELGSP